jgi:hypothetical protein
MARPEEPQAKHDTLDNPDRKGRMAQQFRARITARIDCPPIEYTPYNKPETYKHRTHRNHHVSITHVPLFISHHPYVH